MSADLAIKEYNNVVDHFHTNLFGTRFSMNETVIVSPGNPERYDWNGHIGTVCGVRWANDEFEYAISGVWFLVWEHELRAYQF